MMTLLCAVCSVTWGEEVVDNLTQASIGVSGTNYSNWSGKTAESSAVYAGNSAGGNSSIQLRATSPSGIVTTASGGKVKKVTVTWNSNTANDRVLQVYGKNTAYSNASDLYNNSNKGTLIGTIVKGKSTELTITSDYAFIGLRSSSGAMYLSEIQITWGDGGTTIQTVATPTFSPEGGTYTEAKSVTISCTTDGASIFYTTNGSTPSATNGTLYSSASAITIDATTTLKAIAVKEGYNSSAVATATYTINTPVADYATLPFTFDSGSSAIAGTEGLTQSGLEDYNATNYPNTKLKFGDTGDNLILHFNETPGKLSFYIKGFVFSGGRFTVQTSPDGINYTNLKTYTSDDNITEDYNGQSEEFNLAADVRYIKWVYTTKVSGNIGLGNIKLEKPALPSAGLVFNPTEVTINIGGEFTAPTLTNEHNVTVTYASSNTDVATVDENTGEVTVKNVAGTTTITASFAGNGTYASGSASYTLTVVDPNAPGTENNPYTVAEAIQFINTLGGSTSDEVYVKGIISNVKQVFPKPSQNGYAQYYISDDGTTNTQLYVFNGYFMNGDYFTSSDQIQVGDRVVVKGNLKLYNTNVYEFDKESKIASLGRDEYYVAGTWTNWFANKIKMTKNSDGSYTLQGQVLEEKAKFEIIKEATDDPSALVWYGQNADGDTYWITAANHDNIPLLSELDTNNKKDFELPMAGTWDFTVSFDPSTGAPLLTVDGTWPDYYLVGSFNNWTQSDAYKFVKSDSEPGKFTLSQTIALNDEFQILASDGITWFGASGDNDVLEDKVGQPLSLSTENTKKNFVMKLDNPLEWNLEFDLKGMTLALSNYVDPNGPVVAGTYYKVTSADQLRAGSEYIIVCDNKNVAMGKQDDPYYRGYGAVTISDNKVIIDEDNVDIASVTLGGETGAWTFLASDNGKYLGAQTSDKYFVAKDNASDAEAKWAIEAYEEDGEVIGYRVRSTNSATNTCYIEYNSSQPRFNTYKSTQQKAYLYVKGFEVKILSSSTDGTGAYYATIGSLGERKNFVVTGEGVQVHTVTVSKGKITYEQTWSASEGEILPGDGAYLVESSAPGTYLFPETTEGPTYSVGENMLRSTGEGNVSASEMNEDDADKINMYYKLSMRNGKCGFYWGNEDGAPFEYKSDHKAYLVVPKDQSHGANAFFFDSDATGIYSVNAENEGTENESVYSLSGVRMDSKQLPKGIYIVNGKKMVIK